MKKIGFLSFCKDLFKTKFRGTR